MVKGLMGQFLKGRGPIRERREGEGAKGVAGALVGQPPVRGPWGWLAVPPLPLLSFSPTLRL